MHRPKRDRGISRRSWLLAGLTAPLFRVWAGDDLNPRFDGDTLRVAPPKIHFLTGTPLARLKDGAAVAYVAELDLLDEGRVSVRQEKARFVVSYALWEETFSVTELGKASRTADGLSMAAAEAWCFESLTLNTVGLATDRYFWLRFDMRTGGPRDLEGDSVTGISIKDLIDLLGRRNQTETHWGPLETRVRLADLPRARGRGSRG
ncbi:MAG: hypothetical protein JST11_15750 [Acidobacteria bacterium]|nr:hypothetical protein [Acidobacteriota bacterium]